MEATLLHLFFFFFFCWAFTLFSPLDGRAAWFVSTVSSLPGEDIVLPCRPASRLILSPDLSVEWSRGDGPSKQTLLVLRGGVELEREKADEYEGRTVQAEDYSLKLLAVQLQDNSTYSCVIRRGSAVLHQESVSLIVESFRPQEEGSEVRTTSRVNLPLYVIIIIIISILIIIISISITSCGRVWMKRCRRAVVRWSEFVFRKLKQQTALHADIMKVETTGALLTASANGLRDIGVKASHELAEGDRTEMEKFREDILSVGRSRRLHPAIIAAIISRQSQAGRSLNPSGFGKYDPDCFGLLQINKSYHHVDEPKGPFSRQHLDQGTTYLCELIKTMTKQNPDWTAEQHLKGAVASYIAGPERVIGLTYDKVDDVTPNKDFANDVIARAQWFAANGFEAL